jgi:hypothetical protein
MAVAGTGIDCHGRRFTKQRHNLAPGSLPPAINHSSHAKEEGGNILCLLDDNVVGVIKRNVKQNTILCNNQPLTCERCGGIDASSIKVFTVVGRGCCRSLSTGWKNRSRHEGEMCGTLSYFSGDGSTKQSNWRSHLLVSNAKVLTECVP